jgi:hypothetical protein
MIKTRQLTVTKVLRTIAIALLVVTTSIAVFGSRAQAATISVAAGDDVIADDASCSLSEAITNINDQAQTHDDCAAGTGSNDTIVLPAGTITLTDDLPEIDKSVTVQGQGMDVSIIDGDGAYVPFNVYPEEFTHFTLEDVTITAWGAIAVDTGRGDVTLTNVELDGANSDVTSNGGGGGMIIGNSVAEELNTVVINNVYIHDIVTAIEYIHILNVWNENGATTNATASNVTIDHIDNTNGGVNVMDWGTGVMRLDRGEGEFTGAISNTTINDVSGAGVATIVNVAVATVGGGTADSELTVKNTTISDINSGLSIFGVNGSFGNYGASYDETTTSAAHMSVQNVLINNNVFDGDPVSCAANGALNPVIGGTGEDISLSITSLGGNVVSENSCADFFDHATDQNNVSGLGDTLGALSDNGGMVPTIPLLAGSPAIDGGTVSGVTTDARGVARPQCSTYDSGAFEYNACSGGGDSDDTVLSTPLTNETRSYLVLPEGVSNGSFSTTPASSVPTDGSYAYPGDLVSFSFDTEVGATETVTLYFELPGDPEDYTARKYNATTHAFSDIEGASIVRTTYNGKSMLQLTYDITDGGVLDQDGEANGTIVDPVGLAAVEGLAETGNGVLVVAHVTGLGLIGAMAVFRRRKAYVASR